MADKTAQILEQIQIALREGPLSISEVAKQADINWRTAEGNLELLKGLGLVTESTIKNTRTFFLKDKNNYFDIPVKNEDKKKIHTFYTLIRKACQKYFERNPTKTQAYKILWVLNKKLKLDLPIGWYLHGPICLVPYSDLTSEETKITAKTCKLVEDLTKELGKYDYIQIQKRIYEDAEDKLYITKEKLVNEKLSEDMIKSVLMDLVKYAPTETIDVVSDFVKITLSIGFEKTKECFREIVWKYIALIRFKESLEPYYRTHINNYLDKQISECRQEAQFQLPLLNNRNQINKVI